MLKFCKMHENTKKKHLKKKKLNLTNPKLIRKGKKKCDRNNFLESAGLEPVLSHTEKLCSNFLQTIFHEKQNKNNKISTSGKLVLI